MPGWELAASVYATDVQPDFDADWADDATVGAPARTPSLAFETKTSTSPRLLVAALPEEPVTGGPQFAGGRPVSAPVAAPTAPDPSGALPPGVRVPLWVPSDTAPPPPVDAQIPWRGLATFLVLVLLAGGAYLGYPRAHAWYVARSVPADLRAYVQGAGVPYKPAGQAYTVRLPKEPVRRDSVVGTGTWTVMHRSIVAAGDYHIAIRVAVLSAHAALPFGLVGVLVDRTLAGTARPTNVHEIDFAGAPAYDYDLGGDPPMRGRIFRRANRIYVVTVQAKSAGTVLGAVMDSFVPGGTAPAR